MDKKHNYQNMYEELRKLESDPRNVNKKIQEINEIKQQIKGLGNQNYNMFGEL